MGGPIVYVDRSEIKPGGVDELKARIGELADLVESNEPRIIAYSVYLDDAGTEMSVLHMHRDTDSFATHFRVAGPAFGRFVELVRLKSIDVYGDLTDELVDQLRQKARLLGDAPVSVHPFQAGFARFPAP